MLTATPALAAPCWRRRWSKDITSLTAAATGSQCTKWKQVALWRYELSHPPTDETTFWEPTDEFLNQADYDLMLLLKSWKDEYGADDYACSVALRTSADSVYLPEGQPLV